MRKALRSLYPLLIFSFISWPFCARALQVSGTGSRGCFQGTLVYRCHGDGQAATLTIELTNTAPPGNGGTITGLFLNNPAGKISTVTMSDSAFVLVGGPAWRNGIDASPAGYYDIGASLRDRGDEIGERSSGIAVGQTRTFQLSLSGADLAGLDEYSFAEEAPEGGDHFLAVRFCGFTDGEEEMVLVSQVSNPETVVAPSAGSSVPECYALLPNYPNPFNASTNIGFQLPACGRVSLIIYDVLGRKARHLVDAHQEAGSYIARWNGRDDQGRVLKSGVYFCVFECGGFSQTMKMVLTR